MSALCNFEVSFCFFFNFWTLCNFEATMLKTRRKLQSYKVRLPVLCNFEVSLEFLTLLTFFFGFVIGTLEAADALS